MGLYLDELFNSKTLEGYFKELSGEYCRRAVAHVDSQAMFVRNTKSDHELKSFVASTYEVAKSVGISTERDHLSYLKVSSIIGPNFHEDPQFKFILDQKNAFVASPPSMPAIVHFTNIHLENIHNILDDRKDAVTVLTLNYRRETAWDVARVRALGKKIWPHALRDVPDSIIDKKIQMSYNETKPYQLPAPDVALYILLSFAAGYKFGHDLRYPEIQKALSMEGGVKEKRLAIWNAMRTEFSNQMRLV